MLKYACFILGIVVICFGCPSKEMPPEDMPPSGYPDPNLPVELLPDAGPPLTDLGFPYSMALDRERGRFLVASTGQNGCAEKIMAVDMVTGTFGSFPVINSLPYIPYAMVIDRTNSYAILAGRSFVDSFPGREVRRLGLEVNSDSRIARYDFIVQAIAVDPSSDTIFAATYDYISENSKLVRIELSDGTFEVLSSNSEQSQGPLFLYPESLVYDEPNNRVLLTDSEANQVLSIDIFSGERATISGNGTGDGDELLSPLGIVMDEKRNRVLVGTESAGIVAIDLGTGNRTALASASVGTGPAITAARTLILDTDTDQLYTINSEPGGDILRINMDTGDRVNLSKSMYACK